MEFGRIVLHVNTHRLMESDFFDMSYFQDGSHDVLPPFAAAYAALLLMRHVQQRPPTAGQAHVYSS